MRIIFLNCWYGKRYNELVNFLEAESNQTDIFCFQEVSRELNSDLSRILTDFISKAEFVATKHSEEHEYGQSIFIKNNLKLTNVKKRFDIFKNRFPNYGFLQLVTLNRRGIVLNILNFHGRPQPGHKKDTATRTTSSLKIVDLLKKLNGKIILGGDFNLLPQTKSIKILENFGLLNLISKFEIMTTRNKLAWIEAKKRSKMSKFKFFGRQLFADYCFVSKDVYVSSFEVPQILVSDHLPLILEINV